MKSIKQTQTLQRENCDQIVLDIIDNNWVDLIIILEKKRPLL